MIDVGTTVSLSSPALFPGARAEQRGGHLAIFAPDTAWAQAVSIALPAAPRDPTIIGVRILIDVELLEGSLGLFAATAAGTKVGEEQILRTTSERTTAVIDVGAAASICLRNANTPSARARVYAVRVVFRRVFDITDVVRGLLVSLLKEPGPPALAEVARALSRGRRVVEPDEIGALTCGGAPIPIPFDDLWNDDIGRRVLADTKTLIDLLPTYDPSLMDPRNGYLGRDFFATYLKQSTIRVYHCVRQLREAGVTRGTVLDVGSLFGQFALTLQRLGYEVTVVDRYDTYRGAFDGYVDLMKREGVAVISTTRASEAQRLADLGCFDAVLSMAVIEHIPHTARMFLEMLVSHVAPGGVVMLDTPNIARYWNRKRLAAGESTHQDLENQYYAEVPYEGHHREYTRREMIWMLEQVGCHDIRSRLFDYNLLQFTELWPDHLDALLAMTVEPTLADVILVSGSVGARTD